MSISNEPENPFAPPRAAVLEAARDEGGFIAEGRKVATNRALAWYSEAWRIFTRAPVAWILICVVFILLSALFAVIPLGGIITNLCYPVVAAGLMLACRELEQGGSIGVGYMFRAFSKNPGNLLLVGVLYLVAVVCVGLIVGLGMAIAVPMFSSIPAPASGSAAEMMRLAPIFALVVLVAMALMLPVFMAMWFAPAIVVFHDVQPLAAMRASFKGCFRNFVPFLLFGVVGLGLALLALIPVGLGLLVFGPIVWITMYTAYRDIFLER
jgi:uncharacterized membrane protein